MAVYDRWHRDPGPGDQPCGCGTRRKPLYPSAVHLKGDRWQVRYRNPAGKQRKRDFALRIGPNPELHADAYDAKVQGELDADTYTDPKAGKITLRAYAEDWRKSRTHGESAAGGLEGRLRNHVYEGEPGSGRTPKGGVAIGQHAMSALARRPSLIAAWVAALPLADSTRRLVVGDVSAVFAAAVEDGIVARDPTKSKSVDRPAAGRSKAAPYTAAEIAGITAGMPARLAIVPELGVGTGMREMEMAALGLDDIVRGAKPKIRVVRQLKVIGGEPRFAPLKNRKPHDVPVAQDLVDLIDAHAGRWPPVTVTLPWHEPGGRLDGAKVTVRLILSRESGGPATKNVMDSAWRTAVGRLLASGVPDRRTRRLAARGHGIHRTRHTAASAWLRAGIDVVRVAAWLGDTVDMVTKTYAHLMPDDHAGEDAGRAASAEFLRSCALSVPQEAGLGTSGLLRVV